MATGEYLQPGGPWSESAGNFIMKFLEPAIISFSFGLYSRRQLLKENAAAILAGSFSSAFLGTVTMAILIRIIGVPLSLGLALMPRATAAMAVVQAAMIEASTALTTVHCCFIGLLGANFGPAICDALGLRNPIARGVANGGSGLALASAALASTDPAAFPFGTLTMTLTSTIATILFSMPPFQQMLFYIAGLSPFLPLARAPSLACLQGVCAQGLRPAAGGVLPQILLPSSLQRRSRPDDRLFLQHGRSAAGGDLANVVGLAGA
jgi:putative effector of murein hydrolase